MIAHRRRDVADLNHRAREHLRDAGRLTGPDVDHGDRAYAIGDQVACRRNSTDLEVINGDLGQVREITEAWIRVDLTDGREVLLPADYTAEHIDHGYAITAHRAQGATVDQAFVLGSDELSREWGYTAMTRHRDQAHFYLSAPDPYLNRPGRSLEREQELADTVAHLFENSRQQELALEALERTPGAHRVLEQLDHAATRAENAAERAARLDQDRDETSVLRRGQRRELAQHAEQAHDHTQAARDQLAALTEQFDALIADPNAGWAAQPVRDPVDLAEFVDRGPDHDNAMDMGL